MELLGWKSVLSKASYFVLWVSGCLKNSTILNPPFEVRTLIRITNYFLIVIFALNLGRGKSLRSLQKIRASYLASMESRKTAFWPYYLEYSLFFPVRRFFLMLEQVARMPCQRFVLFYFVTIFLQVNNLWKGAVRLKYSIHLQKCFHNLVVAIIKLIYSVKYNKEERYAHE